LGFSGKTLEGIANAAVTFMDFPLQVPTLKTVPIIFLSILQAVITELRVSIGETNVQFNNCTLVSPMDTLNSAIIACRIGRKIIETIF